MSSRKEDTVHIAACEKKGGECAVVLSDVLTFSKSFMSIPRDTSKSLAPL
jgi:hypothetical protein